MIRFTLALKFLLMGSLFAPAFAVGQEPPKGAPPGGNLAGQADPAAALDKAQSKNEKILAEFGDLLNYQHVPSLATTRNWAVTSSFDALEANFGLSLSEADDTLRAQLEIPQGRGVVVVGVKAGSLAEHAGLKLNDVLLSLGDQELKTRGQARTILLGLGKEALEVKLIREGKARRMSLVGPEHGFPPEAAEYWIGTPVSPVDATLRSHLPSLPGESGLVVNDVVKGSPSEQASIQKDDILVAMDGKPLKNSDALIAQIQASQGKPVPMHLLRAGKPLTVTITPAKRTHPTVINVRQSPEAQLTYQVVRPYMAIEVEPGSRAIQAGQVSQGVKAIESKPNAAGGVTLYAPYSGVMLDPYSGVQTPTTNIPTYLNSRNPNTGVQTPTTNFPTYLNSLNYYQPQPNNDPSTARIEAQLKEVVAKLEEINKSLEGLKKSAGK